MSLPLEGKSQRTTLKMHCAGEEKFTCSILSNQNKTADDHILFLAGKHEEQQMEGGIVSKNFTKKIQ